MSEAGGKAGGKAGAKRGATLGATLGATVTSRSGKAGVEAGGKAGGATVTSRSVKAFAILFTQRKKPIMLKHVLGKRIPNIYKKYQNIYQTIPNK